MGDRDRHLDFPRVEYIDPRDIRTAFALPRFEDFPRMHDVQTVHDDWPPKFQAHSGYNKAFPSWGGFFNNEPMTTATFNGEDFESDTASQASADSSGGKPLRSKLTRGPRVHHIPILVEKREDTSTEKTPPSLTETNFKGVQQSGSPARNQNGYSGSSSSATHHGQTQRSQSDRQFREKEAEAPRQKKSSSQPPSSPPPHSGQIQGSFVTRVPVNSVTPQEHRMNRDPNQMNRDPHQMNRDPHQMNRDPHQMNRDPHQMNKDPHQMNRDPHQMNRDHLQMNRDHLQMNRDPYQVNRDPHQMNRDHHQMNRDLHNREYSPDNRRGDSGNQHHPYQQPPPQQQQQYSEPQTLPVPAQPNSQRSGQKKKPKPNPKEQIEAILGEMMTLREEVLKFPGTTKDKKYRYLDEMLTRCMLKLDDVNTEGLDEIRQERKRAVKNIQDCIGLLENKIAENEALAKQKEQAQQEVPAGPGDSKGSGNKNQDEDHHDTSL